MVYWFSESATVHLNARAEFGPSEVELPESDYCQSTELGDSYRQESLKYIKSSLGLCQERMDTQRPTIKAFELIGAAFRKGYNHGMF